MVCCALIVLDNNTNNVATCAPELRQKFESQAIFKTKKYSDQTATARDFRINCNLEIPLSN